MIDYQPGISFVFKEDSRRRSEHEKETEDSGRDSLCVMAHGLHTCNEINNTKKRPPDISCQDIGFRIDWDEIFHPSGVPYHYSRLLVLPNYI